MEPGETPEEALRREVLEETGLHIEVGELAGEAVLPAVDASDRYLVRDFFATLTPGTTMHPRAGDDAEDVRWVTGSEFLELEVTPELAQTLQSWNTWESDS